MNNGEDKTIAWLRLARIKGLGPVLGRRLLESLGGVEQVFAADEAALSAVEGVGRGLASRLRDPASRDRARREYDACLAAGVSVAHLEHPDYPPLLTQIADPPLVLYVRGQLGDHDDDRVGVVGCRNPDPYGQTMSASMGAGLARYGITVVSGMARGVDGIAMGAALKAEGKTIAVLGAGVDVIYPPEHDQLYRAIIERGAAVSEFPLGSGPQPSNFPRRNRIISGISQGVVMVQAMSERSGALITIRHAFEQGREVYAVPGNAGARAGRMGNGVIKSGGKLVESADDVVLDLRPLGTVPLLTAADKQEQDPKAAPALPDAQARIYVLVPSPAEGTIGLDDLAAQAGEPAQEVAGALLELELAGLVRAMPGKRYVRIADR